MNRLYKVLALSLCMAILLSAIPVSGSQSPKTLLTLEEAKSLALEDNTQYKIQNDYIEKKKEDYNDLADRYSGNRAKGSSIVEKTASYVSSKVAIDNAYNAWRLEIFKKDDIKRQSDYDVTIAYYDVMKAKYSLDDAQRAMELSQKDLDIAKLKLNFGIITNNELSQAENSYKASETKYNSALSELKNKMDALGKEIGKDLDVASYDIDMKISIPDIDSIDMDAIREDYLNNSTNFYTLKASLDTAKYAKYLIEDKYDEYTEDNHRLSDTIEDAFEDLKYDANRDYDNVKYNYDQGIKSLDTSLNTQYTGINTTMESIENLRKNLKDTKAAVENSKISYDMGLISKIEYEKSESALKDMENALNTAIINLNTQYLNLTQYSYTREK